MQRGPLVLLRHIEFTVFSPSRGFPEASRFVVGATLSILILQEKTSFYLDSYVILFTSLIPQNMQSFQLHCDESIAIKVENSIR